MVRRSTPAMTSRGRMYDGYSARDTFMRVTLGQTENDDSSLNTKRDRSRDFSTCLV